MFVGYAAFMDLAMRGIEAAAVDMPPAPIAVRSTPDAAADVPAVAPPGDMTAMLLMNVAFWFLTIQPTVTMSLYVPRYVPGLAVSTTYWVTTVTVLLLQMRVTRLAGGAAGHRLFLAIGIVCMATSFATMALSGGHVAPVLVAAVLLALSQVFYSPSLDVLVTGDARARGLDLGKTMARQLFWQNLGMMSGSLFAGALFDQALRLGTPSLGWSVPAAASIALLAAWAFGMRGKRH
jgi:MFS family permease